MFGYKKKPAQAAGAALSSLPDKLLALDEKPELKGLVEITNVGLLSMINSIVPGFCAGNSAISTASGTILQQDKKVVYVKVILDSGQTLPQSKSIAGPIREWYTRMEKSQEW